MNVILVSGSGGRTRSLTVSAPQIALLTLVVSLVVVCFAVTLNYFSLRYAVSNDSPYLRTLLLSLRAQENQQVRSYLRESLNTMAGKLGEMQAKLSRLDVLGERLSKEAGFKPQEFMFDRAPARGGAESDIAGRELSMTELGAQLDGLAIKIEDRMDKLGMLESTLTEVNARKQFMPSGRPLQEGFSSSHFGWRIDPFTGINAFHEGMDFMAEQGVPIQATAGGVVVFAALHPQYGNMIEVDHGNDLVTRYAHASKLLVKVGDVVLRGNNIAEVGSTGRSTGTHLHFEVRQRGVAQDPARFLRTPG